MSFHIDYHAEAVTDEQTIYRRYRDQSYRTGDRFIKAFDAALDRIEQNPLQFSLYLENTRACKLKRFPYLVIFRAYSRNVTIFAISHTSRQQTHWRNRLP